jgi:Cu(I)/Ag(I) efflux system membrane protein CusA/SilA
MKPLATPVLGGMVSSLALVLIVTPVIFYWLRERELRRAEAAQVVEGRSTPARSAIEPVD